MGSAEYSILYFAETRVFRIFVAKYKVLLGVGMLW